MRLRGVFASPGMASLYASTFVGRVAGSSGPMLITLYAVTTLGRSYSQAGWVNSVLVIGAGVAAPVGGWVLDRGRGRLLVGITAVIEAAFWLFAGHLGYVALVFAAVATAAFALPSSTLPRWVIATRVDESTRQAAYTVDSICSEASYMVGPPVAILLATTWGTGPTFAVLAGLTVLVGIAYLKPAHMTRVQAVQPGPGTPAALSEAAPRTRSALRAAIGPFVVVGAAMILLAATEVLLVAMMRSRHEMDHLSILVLIWCASSIVGALVFAAGALPGKATLLLGAMALCSTVIGLAPSWWQTALLLIPSGFLNAPVLAATSEWLNRVIPAPLRGRFTGWHTLAVTVGLAIGAPAGGVLADQVPLWLSFCVLGLVGLLAALVAAALSRTDRKTTAQASRRDRPSRPMPDDPPGSVTVGRCGRRGGSRRG